MGHFRWGSVDSIQRNESRSEVFVVSLRWRVPYAWRQESLCGVRTGPQAKADKHCTSTRPKTCCTVSRRPHWWRHARRSRDRLSVRRTPGHVIQGLGGSHRVRDRVVPLIEPVARSYAIELESTASIDRDAEEAAECRPPGCWVRRTRLPSGATGAPRPVSAAWGGRWWSDWWGRCRRCRAVRGSRRPWCRSPPCRCGWSPTRLPGRVIASRMCMGTRATVRIGNAGIRRT